MLAHRIVYSLQFPSVLALGLYQSNCGSVIWGVTIGRGAYLRCSPAPFALKEKKDNQEKTSNREACEKSRDQVQRVMYY